ncbi:MAG: type II secretion system F family protein [Anaerolineae bacterium]
MTSIYSLLFGVTVAGVIFTLALALRSGGEVGASEEDRLYSFAASTPVTLEDVELSQPFAERVIRPAVSRLLNFFGRLTPQSNLQELQHRLELAGRPYGWTVVNFVGLRVVVALALGFLGFMLSLLGDLTFLQRLLLALALVGLGYFLPILWLGRRTRERQSALLRALPDGLDMLNICVGAGLGFDAALSRVSEQWRTPLADEFNRVVAEIRLGKTRRQALLDLARRTEVMELENFVATIVQADQLGVSIAKVLRTQAEQMRILRRQRAEEQARQASIKLLFPLVFMIFPSLLAVLLGPAIPKILDAFGSF